MQKAQLKKLVAGLFPDSHSKKHIELLTDFLNTAAIRDLSDAADIKPATFIQYVNSCTLDASVAFYRNYQQQAGDTDHFFHVIFNEYIGKWRARFARWPGNIEAFDQVAATGLLKHFAVLYDRLVSETYQLKSLHYLPQQQMSPWEILILSAEPGCFEYVVKTLLVTKDTIGFEGNTILHWAVRSGSAEQVRKALDLGVNPNAKTRSGMTAMHFAALLGVGDASIIDMIWNFKYKYPFIIDINSLDAASLSPLYYAFEANHYLAMLWLIQHDPDADKLKYNLENAEDKQKWQDYVAKMRYYQPSDHIKTHLCCQYYCCAAWIYIKQYNMKDAFYYMLLALDTSRGEFHFSNEWFDVIKRGLIEIIKSNQFSPLNLQYIKMRLSLTNTEFLPDNLQQLLSDISTDPIKFIRSTGFSSAGMFAPLPQANNESMLMSDNAEANDAELRTLQPTL